jgi:GH18 family chitinase
VTANESSGESFSIVGYLPDYRFAEFHAEQALGLTDLVLFSAMPSADGSLDTSKLTNCPWPLLQTLKSKNGLRVHLAVGGWGRSEHFAKVSSTAELRGHFVRSALQFCKEHQLDGIDLDWEHPRNATEEQSYGLLLGDLRRACEPLGLRLSVTVAAWQTLVPEAVQSANVVQIMAYDHDGKHSTLEGAMDDVQRTLKQGVPVEKLFLGVPFYGRNVSTRDAMTYRDIVAKLNPPPGADQVDAVYFNGPDTIATKVRQAKEMGMPGVMIWEIGQDASGELSLLRAVRSIAEESNR